MGTLKTQTHFKVAGLRKEINNEMQTLLNTIKPLTDVSDEFMQTMREGGEILFAFEAQGSHLVKLIETYRKIDELCNRVIQIQKEESERRVIL